MYLYFIRRVCRNYVPVYLYSSIINTFWASLLYITVALFSVPSYVAEVIHTALWPRHFNNVDALYILVSVMMSFSVYLIFGVSSPPLALALLVEVFVRTKFWRVAIGRCVLYHFPSHTGTEFSARSFSDPNYPSSISDPTSVSGPAPASSPMAFSADCGADINSTPANSASEDKDKAGHALEEDRGRTLDVSTGNTVEVANRYTYGLYYMYI
jgi:hypothetical protein